MIGSGQWVVFAVILLAMAALLGLVVTARSEWNRLWALFFLLAFPLSMALWWMLPLDTPRWIAGLPFYVLAIVFGLMLARRGARHGPPPPHRDGEMLYTQEELRGAAGTRQALLLYFGLLLAVLAIWVVLRLLYPGNIW